MSKKQEERNQLILKIHREHPNITLQAIGRPFGITKQRVFAIIRDTAETNQNQNLGGLRLRCKETIKRIINTLLNRRR